MGTRADFYVLKEKSELEWVGSIAWDGDDIDGVEMATTEQGYRNLIQEVMGKRDDFTSPEQGWPWPWDDSSLTDKVYVFADGEVWQEHEKEFARFKDLKKYYRLTEGEQESMELQTRDFVLPDMSALKNVTYGKRSGVIIIGLK